MVFQQPARRPKEAASDGIGGTAPKLHPGPKLVAVEMADRRLTTDKSELRETAAAYVGLFASVSTLVCCALPALLVLLGFGLTSVLTFFGAIPGWQAFGAYTMWLFPITGVFLALGFYLAFFRARPAEVCEIPEGGRESACSTATRWNRRILWLSLALYLIALVTDFWGIGWMRAHGYFNR